METIEIPDELELLKQRNDSLEGGSYLKCTITIGKGEKSVTPHIIGKGVGIFEKAELIVALRHTADRIEKMFPETKIITAAITTEDGGTLSKEIKDE